MKRWLYHLGTVIALSCSISAQAQGPTANTARKAEDKILSARDMKSPVDAAIADPSYSIGPGDVLTIDVWKEPEISRTLPVRTDGKISLPLLNDVQAGGFTPTQLGFEITERLRKVMVNPQVTVIVAEMNSQRIYILGQVLHGGAYPFLPNMTTVQALSSAGGFTPYANLKKIYVMRIENGRKKILPINFKDMVSARNPEKDLQLNAGDTIVVP